jgi:type II secretory pathway component GspD/PulD (secretin)
MSKSGKQIVAAAVFFMSLSTVSSTAFGMTNVIDEASMPDDIMAGGRFTLDLRDVDLRELFKIFSIRTGLMIVPTKNVQGRVSVFLNNVTFSESLDVIATSADLAYERGEKKITFMTADEYQKMFGVPFNERRIQKAVPCRYADPVKVREMLQSVASKIGSVAVDEATGTLIMMDAPDRIAMMESVLAMLDKPLDTQVFALNYASSEEIMAKVSEQLQSDSGSVVSDIRTNTVIVADLPARLERIRDMVQAFDEASRQVEIEGRILQVSLDCEHKRGIEWEKIFRHLDDLTVEGVFSQSGLPSYGQVSLASLNEDNYSLVLQLLERQGEVRTISNPRIVAVNNKEARIHVGLREAFVTSTRDTGTDTTLSVETDKVEYVDVGVKLDVIPVIGADGYVTMTIKPELSSVSRTLETSAGSIIPIVETSTAETVVKVKDGSLVMIAGLLKDKTDESAAGIMGAEKIPIVGRFLGKKGRGRLKTEFVVFLKPRIVSGEEVTDAVEQSEQI